MAGMEGYDEALREVEKARAILKSAVGKNEDVKKMAAAEVSQRLIYALDQLRDPTALPESE